jgi:hypothetical protein
MMNRRQIAFGESAAVFTPENLSQTFGGYLTLWQDQSRVLVISDDPCAGHTEE